MSCGGISRLYNINESLSSLEGGYSALLLSTVRASYFETYIPAATLSVQPQQGPASKHSTGC